MKFNRFLESTFKESIKVNSKLKFGYDWKVVLNEKVLSKKLKTSIFVARTGVEPVTSGL